MLSQKIDNTANLIVLGTPDCIFEIFWKNLVCSEKEEKKFDYMLIDIDLGNIGQFSLTEQLSISLIDLFKLVVFVEFTKSIFDGF